MNFHEDNLTMAPASVAIHSPERDFVYAFRCGAVVLSVEKVAKTRMPDKTECDPHTFFVSIRGPSYFGSKLRESEDSLMT